MSILAIVLCGIAALLNLVAAIGVRGQATADGHAAVSVVLPQLIYVAAAVALAGAAVLRGVDLVPWARAIFVAGALFAIAAPLLYGQLIGEFTISHHAIRLVLVAAVGVVLWLS